MFERGVRAEIPLARGDTEAGLRLWRRAAEPAPVVQDPLFHSRSPGLEPWTLETQAAAVIAHVRHGRLDRIADVARELPYKLRTLLTVPAVERPAYAASLPICGAVLLALGMLDLDRGATVSAARLIALAERFRYLRGFQPTMSSARVRKAAENADGAAYADAVSTYAALGHEELMSEALELLGAHEA